MKGRLAFAFLLGCCISFAQVSKKDTKFAVCASELAQFEARAGKLAQLNGANEEIKSLGRLMAGEHDKMNQELKVLADKKKITCIPAMLSSKDQKKYDELTRLRGKDFDKKYAKSMVKSHEKAIGIYKEQAKKGDDAELKSWASSKVTMLESHKKQWKDACKNLK